MMRRLGGEECRVRLDLARVFRVATYYIHQWYCYSVHTLCIAVLMFIVAVYTHLPERHAFVSYIWYQVCTKHTGKYMYVRTVCAGCIRWSWVRIPAAAAAAQGTVARPGTPVSRCLSDYPACAIRCIATSTWVYTTSFYVRYDGVRNNACTYLVCIMIQRSSISCVKYVSYRYCLLRGFIVIRT